MTHSLRERQDEYESNCDYSLLRRLPVIIRVTIKSYKRLVQNLDRPYCVELNDIMSQTMLYTITNIQDAVFGYYHNDEIIFVLRNDKDFDYVPWCNNNIQKIVSVVSSLATLGFYKSVEIFGDNIALVGDAIFEVKAFNVPKVSEAVNYLICRQNICMNHAINSSSMFELESKLGRAPAVSLLKDKSYQDKEELLLHHCGIDFYDYYPSFFLSGMGVYKIPTLVKTQDGGVSRNRWHIDNNIPIFADDRDFILNILNNGLDVFRAVDIL